MLKITKSKLIFKGSDSFFNDEQLKIITRKTPSKEIKKREVNGVELKYVSGRYIKYTLNLLFNWDWDFEIVSHEVSIAAQEVSVIGRLTCRNNGKTIVKMQAGSSNVKMRGRAALNLGNSIKSAATDSLKKCALELGICSDLYTDDIEINGIDDDDFSLEALKKIFEDKKEVVPSSEYKNFKRIIDNKEEDSYKKAILTIKKY